MSVNEELTESQADPAEDPQSSGPSLELERNDLYSDYMLYSRTEILFILRSLIKQRALITVFFDHGRNLLPTSLLAITAQDSTLIFDRSHNEDLNQRLLFAEHPIFTASLDRVKIQFRVDRLTEAVFEGRPAFQGALPEALLRLQRREFFRLLIPVSAPVLCKIPPQEPAAEAQDSPAQAEMKLMEFFVADISGGGIGLTVPENQSKQLPIGAMFSGCQMNLPGEGVITATLEVRNSFSVTTPRGFFRRVGCQFVDLPGTQMALIQRYIIRTERERKARESGME
ncbi:MAG: flagellar brake protein [Betaproteobacteria bacterium]|nr:flagellar brake protein [Betaproteobacteria bacterium]